MSQLFDTGTPVAVRTAKQARDRHHDRYRIAIGNNRERMRLRRARRKGLTLSEYERQRRLRQEEQARREEATYEWAEERAKRADMREELEAERRAAHNAAMRLKYWTDPDNWSTRKKRRLVFEADGWRCRICGKRVSDNVPRSASNRAVAGHIVARATGGEWTTENMCTLCYPCNVADGVNRLPIQTRLAL